MPKGRPPSTSELDPSRPGPVVQHVGEIDERNRLTVPSSCVEEIGWLSNQALPRQTLVVLSEPGRIALMSWDTEGDRVLQRRAELIEQATRDNGALEYLRALEDRYKRLAIPKGETRPTLSLEILLHLGVHLNVRPIAVYVLRMTNRLEVWSTAYRNQKLAGAAATLGDLP